METNSCQWVGSVSDAPTLRPTTAAFHDPHKFIRGIRHILDLYGAVKVIPPHSFSLGALASAAVKSDETEIELVSQFLQPEQQPQQRRSGRYCASSDYESMANQALHDEFGNLPPSQPDVEIKFWEYMSQIDPPAARVENSLPILESGFSKVDDSACSNEWNLADLPYHKDSLFRHFDESMDELWWSPRMAFRMLFSHVPWQMQGLGSIHYVHTGAGTTWYSIPPSAKADFEAAKEKITGPISPEYLKECGVPIFKLCQYAGEIVIVAPLANRFILSHGFEIMESVGVGLREWIDSPLFNDPSVPIEYAICKEKESVKRNAISPESAACIKQAEGRLLNSIQNDLRALAPHIIDVQSHPDVLLLLDRFYGFKCGACGHYCHLAMLKLANGLPGEFCTRCARSRSVPNGGYQAILSRSLPMNICRTNGRVETRIANCAQSASSGFHFRGILQREGDFCLRSGGVHTGGGKGSKTGKAINKVWRSFRKAESNSRAQTAKQQAGTRRPSTPLESEDTKRIKGNQGCKASVSWAPSGAEQVKSTPMPMPCSSGAIWGNVEPQKLCVAGPAGWRPGSNLATGVNWHSLQNRPLPAQYQSRDKSAFPQMGPNAAPFTGSAAGQPSIDKNPFIVGSRGIPPGQGIVGMVPTLLHPGGQVTGQPAVNGSGWVLLGGHPGQLSRSLGGVDGGPAEGLLRELSGMPIARCRSGPTAGGEAPQPIQPSRIVSHPPGSAVAALGATGNPATAQILCHGGLPPNLSRMLAGFAPSLLSDVAVASAAGQGFVQRPPPPGPGMVGSLGGLLGPSSGLGGHHPMVNPFAYPTLAQQPPVVGGGGVAPYPAASSQPVSTPPQKEEETAVLPLRVVDSTPVGGLQRRVLAAEGGTGPKFLFAADVVAALLGEPISQIPPDVVYSTTHGVFRRAAEVAAKEGMPVPDPPRFGLIDCERHVVLGEEDIRVLHFALDADKRFTETLDTFVAGVWEGGLLDNNVVLSTWRQGQLGSQVGEER
ncbi:hypothetical protein BSKO_08574 [Bryopsis sp. KO-2023]|nr:hypothetical protein BSKO_08574 [Bryopsis sp. KO-2023]